MTSGFNHLELDIQYSGESTALDSETSKKLDIMYENKKPCILRAKIKFTDSGSTIEVSTILSTVENSTNKVMSGYIHPNAVLIAKTGDIWYVKYVAG